MSEYAINISPSIEQSEAPSSTASTIFFLAFIAEIRNQLYDVLFRRSIHLVNDDEFDTPKASVPGINLLATCRQIHSEATCILYARNAFTVSGHSDLCHDNNAHTCRGIDTWLTEIGRQRDLVRTVFVDLDAPCKHSHEMLVPNVDFTYITRQRLLNSTRNPNIVFNRTASISANQDIGTISNPDYDVPALNALLERLAARGTADLDFCVKLRRLCRICVDQSASNLRFDYRHQLFHQYQKLQNGQYARETLRPETHIEGVTSRYPRVSDYIISLIIGSSQTFEYDVNNCTVSPQIPSILVVSHRMRRWADVQMATAKFNLRCTLPNGAVSPHVLDNLERWADIRGLSHLRRWNRNDWDLRPYGEPTIILAVAPHADHTTESVRIDALALFWSTFFLKGETKVRVQQHHGVLRESAVSLSCIRRRILHFLDILAQLKHDDREWPCPTLWMNEQCKISCATFTQSSTDPETVQNEQADWTPDEWSKDDERLAWFCFMRALWDIRNGNMSLEQLMEEDEDAKEELKKLSGAHRLFKTRMESMYRYILWDKD